MSNRIPEGASPIADPCPDCGAQSVYFLALPGLEFWSCSECGWQAHEDRDDAMEADADRALRAWGESLPGPPASPGRRTVDRRTQIDLFVADLIDVSTKDTRQHLEFPVFSISKKPDLEIRHYEDRRRGLFLEVTPSVKGLATIHDKDILIYCASQIVAAINRGGTPAQTVRFTSYDLLSVTNRGVGGASYKRMEAALERLSGTRLKTNIATGGQRPSRRGAGFGLIDSWSVVQKSDGDRALAIEVKLSDWFYNAVTAIEVLTLDREYFTLKSPLDRALYELARKHCGNQRSRPVRVETLHAKTGSRSPLWKFRQLLKKAIDADALPTYRLTYRADDHEIVVIERRDAYEAPGRG